MDGLITHIKLLKSTASDYKSFYGPVLIFDAVHTMGLLWRILVCRNVPVNKNALLNKKFMVEMHAKETNIIRKPR